MRPDLETWTCGQCKRTVLVPSEQDNPAEYLYTLARIREHRFAHLTETLMHGSDEDLLGLCEDEPAEPFVPSCWADESEEARRRANNTAMGRPPYRQSAPKTEPVSQEDVDSCIATVTGILEADLPRAKRLWYPIREDGSFNREEDK